jgi:hypothetical protein
MNDNFIAINNYLGWGDPDGGIWFVGLEEASGWEFTENGQLIENHKKEFRRYKEAHDGIKDVGPGEIADAMYEQGKKYTRIDPIIAKLAILSTTNSNLSTIHRNRICEYMTNVLYQKGSKVLRINLYPLGKKTMNTWDENYGKFFGFEDKDDYYRAMKGERGEDSPRFKSIRERWGDKYKPQVTVCFGKCGFNDFKNVFQLTNSDPKKIDADGVLFEVFEQKRVILTPFFRYGGNAMNNKRIERLAEVISTDFGFRFPQSLQSYKLI